MGSLNRCLAAVAAVSVAVSAPALADDFANRARADDAEQLRKLDIMLMVTGLRCRGGADDFQADYARFTTSHMAELNEAADILRADYVDQVGTGNPDRALDRLSTAIANQYGQGHPWLSCAELKTATRDLADVQGTPTLIEAADQLLAPADTMHIALALSR